MPRPRRKKLVGESLVPGLRMEPDLARAFIQYAHSHAEHHGLPSPNLTAAARDLLRRGLEMCSNEHSCKKEGYFAGLAEARQKMAQAIRT